MSEQKSNRNNTSTWAIVLSITAILLCILVFMLWIFEVIPHSVISSETFIGACVTLLSIIVTIAVGWQIFNAIEVKSTIRDFAQKQAEVDKLATCYSFNDLTSPPDKSARANRMSPVGVSMFYASMDMETARRECTGDEPNIVVGHFKPRKPLKIIDFTRLQMLSFWMENFEPNHFLYLFHAELVKSLAPDDTNAISYVPSQVFTEYLRYMFKDEKGNHIDGMVYKSAKTNGHNIVLFYDQQTSRDILKLVGYNATHLTKEESVEFTKQIQCYLTR